MMHACPRRSRRRSRCSTSASAAARGDSRSSGSTTDCRWAEGPVYFPAGRYLVWSDIPNDRMLRWDETTGAVGVFRHPAGYTNGNTLDRRGPARHLRARQPARHPHRARRLDHRARRPLSTASGSTAPTTSSCAPTARSGSPTRPTASTATTRATGPRARSAAATCTASIPATGDVHASSPTTSCARTASPSRSTSSASTSPTPARNHIRVFDVGDDGALTGGEVLRRAARRASSTASASTTPGRIWAAAGDGVHCFDPDGTLIGKLLVPEPVANLMFGGPKRNRLFMTAPRRCTRS